MTNKEIVLKFYEEVFNAHDLSKLDDYMREDYIQHNPNAVSGREGFRQFANGFFQWRATAPSTRSLTSTGSRTASWPSTGTAWSMTWAVSFPCMTTACSELLTNAKRYFIIHLNMTLR